MSPSIPTTIATIVTVMCLTMVTALSSFPPSSFRLLLDNDRVRVHDLRLMPGESIRHQLEYPTVRWQVDNGSEKILEGRPTLVATPGNKDDGNEGDGQRQQRNEESSYLDDDDDVTGLSEFHTIHVPDKKVFFEETGTVCKIQNGATTKRSESDSSNSTALFRQIWFEIKQEPTRSEEATKRILSDAIYTTDVGTELLLENRYCRVWDFSLPPGGGDPHEPHHHVLPYVFVYVAKGRLLGYSHDGKPGLFDSINEDGDVSWFDIPDGAGHDVTHAHAGKNGYPDLPMREYLVELK
jgi:hypothetical protein